jgi:putative addiction module CopG family antidote
MAFSLARENQEFIKRMLRAGRFNNQSEVIREALRRLEREESAFLNPPSLTKEEAERIYGANPEEENSEHALAKAALRAIRRSRLASEGKPASLWQVL